MVNLSSSGAFSSFARGLTTITSSQTAGGAEGFIRATNTVSGISVSAVDVVTTIPFLIYQTITPCAITARKITLTNAVPGTGINSIFFINANSASTTSTVFGGYLNNTNGNYCIEFAGVTGQTIRLLSSMMHSTVNCIFSPVNPETILIEPSSSNTAPSATVVATTLPAGALFINALI